MVSIRFLSFLLLGCVPYAHGHKKASGSGCAGAKFMTQPIDHFGNHNGTFRQQYQLDTQYYKPGGPILLFQGEETTSMICVETTIMQHFAKELGGIAAAIEHRYFGLSAPFGNDSYSRENIKYLTLDNTMADGVSFVDMIRSNVTGAHDSKVILASGSYGGALVTFMRTNHPDAFFGSISSAAPIRGYTNSTTDRFSYAWFDWLSRTYWAKSAAASARISDGFDAIAQRLQSNGSAKSLQREFSLCTAPAAGDFARLAITFIAVLSLASEFNYAQVQADRSPIANSLDVVINSTLAHSDPLQALNASLWNSWYKPHSLPCIDWATGPSVAAIQSTPFNYITCTYLPLNSADVGNSTIFSPRSHPRDAVALADLDDLHPAGCRATWGVDTPPQSAIYRRYRLTTRDVVDTGRIVFSRGEYDPTSAMGPQGLPSNGSVDASQVLLVSNMAHREDLFAPAPGDRAEVVRARRQELEIIKGWLGRKD